MKLSPTELENSEKAAMLFLISGPSAVAKTLICTLAVQEFSDLYMPRKHTTRRRRPSEPDNEYFFVSDKEFNDLIRCAKFVAHTRAHGYRYGISHEELRPCLSGEKKAILVWNPLSFPEFNSVHTVSIFVAPNDPEALSVRPGSL